MAVLSPPPMVTVPTTTIPVPLASNDSTSPPTVACPPAVRICPAMSRDDTTDGVIDENLVVKVDGEAPFTITAFPEGDREITCPFTVTTSPGVSVCVPITKSDFESFVKVDEAITKVGAGVIGGMLVRGGSVITSPPSVMADPGKSVSPLITKPDAEFSVTLEPPTTTTAEGEVAVGALDDPVAPLITIPPPD